MEKIVLYCPAQIVLSDSEVQNSLVHFFSDSQPDKLQWLLHRNRSDFFITFFFFKLHLALFRGLVELL